MHLNSAANVCLFLRGSLREPHCGAGFAEGCETSCLTLAMHRLSAESSQARHWLEIRTMVFWTLRLCVDFFPGPSGLIHILTLWNIFWNICTHSSRCFVSAVTLSCFVNSLCLPAVGTALLCSRVLGSLPWLFVDGFSGPNPWLFYFLHGHLARVSSTKSNNFNANFSFGITAAVHSMEPAQF